MKTLNERGLITTDPYGPVPYELFKKLQRANVSPADWDTIRDAFYDMGLNLNYQKAWDHVSAHIHGGIYISPWPLTPGRIVRGL